MVVREGYRTCSFCPDDARCDPAAENRADFIHKLRIVLKELNETKSWLEQIEANGLFSRGKRGAIIGENQELCWIIAGSIKTARGSGSPI